MNVTIPGALADFLAGSSLAEGENDHDPAHLATRLCLEAGKRGRGRTLIIHPTSTDVLDVISQHAETLLNAEPTTAERRAARLWIERAGHARPTVKTEQPVEQPPAPARDEPSDWWTITDPATGKEAARVYGETADDMTPRAEALPEVRAIIRKHRGFSRRRLYVSELTPGQLAEQQRQHAAARTDAEEHAADRTAHRAADAVEHAETTGARVDTVADAVAMYDAQLAAPLYCTIHGDACDHDPKRRHEFRPTPAAPDEIEQAVEAVVAADLAAGTWRGEWIGEQPADGALFAVERPVEQGALFDPAARPAEPAPTADDTVSPAPAPTVREQQRAALARIRAKADADRAAYRAATDDRIAADCAAHGVPAPRTVAARIAARTEQPPTRRPSTD
ncbi:hypothetical protein AB0E11_27855 [Streptomyces fradiae]|uniref:hypothetical protein n=1 Tax=Streptomyces fradiae TaxID=1906 RepID=UPI0033CF3067